jgi:hypothetical protein
MYAFMYVCMCVCVLVAMVRATTPEACVYTKPCTHTEQQTSLGKFMKLSDMYIFTYIHTYIHTNVRASI